MKKTRITRFFSLLLCCLMLVGILPMGQVAYAAGDIEFTTQPQSGTAPKTGSYTFTWEVSGTPVDVVLQEYRISDSEWSNRTSVKNVTSYTVTYNENVSKYRLLAQDSINIRYYSNEVTVTWTGEEAFRFTTQPQSGTAPKTGSHTFTWAFSETPDDATWQEYWISTSEWVNISSVTDATSKTVTYNDNVSKYRIMARKGSKTIYSNEVSVTWTGEEAFRFTTQPQSGTAPKTGSYTFTWALDEAPDDAVWQEYRISTSEWVNMYSVTDKTSQTVTYNDNVSKYRIMARKGSKTIYSNEVTVTWLDDSVTTYTVTFDANGGSAVTAQTIEAGQKATKPADPTKDGYDFKGWTLNGSAYDFNSAVNGNITLVATWEAKQVVPTTYTVSFAANGGTGSMADVTGISGEYTLPANGFTAPEGKQFKAWSVGGVEKAVGDKITVTADTTVTAVWETIPAGHTCDIKPVAKVEPSCTEGGKEAYYKCEGCGKFYEDALGAKEITDLAAWGNLEKLGHTESGWKSDKDNHWKECTVAGCGVIIENSKAAHKDDNNDGKCDVCEYNVGTTTTKPEDTNKPSDDVQSPQTGDNSMMWLWVALLFVSGFGVVATTVIGKKKSSAK